MIDPLTDIMATAHMDVPIYTETAKDMGLEEILAELTHEYLYPALEAAGVENPEQCSLEWEEPPRSATGVGCAPMRSRPAPGDRGSLPSSWTLPSRSQLSGTNLDEGPTAGWSARGARRVRREYERASTGLRSDADPAP